MINFNLKDYIFTFLSQKKSFLQKVKQRKNGYKQKIETQKFYKKLKDFIIQ